MIYYYSSVTEMMYSNDDINEMFNKIKDEIHSSMEKEISYYLNMNAIFVQLLLHDAENQTVTLQVETSQAENMTNMKEMNQFIDSLSNLTLPDTKGQTSKLSSISNTVNLINDYETLKHDYDILNENVVILKKQNEMLLNENNALNANSKASTETINQLRKQIKDLTTKMMSPQPDNKANVDLLNQIQYECEETKKKLDEQMEKYQALVKDFEKKVSESTQFKQLKKLLQDKNVLIVQLKTSLTKYEK